MHHTPDDDIPSPKVGDTWYRFEDRRYANLDDDDFVVSQLAVELKELRVKKVTPKGVKLVAACCWNRDWDIDLRFVLLDAKKRYAHPTKELALKSFVARKEAQVRIYQSRISDAKTALLRAQALLDRNTPR